ncbi:glycoside hydrolase family 24 protein [Proteus mirabilis]|uniref:glycoside hydrolase family 24 protein n=1 Tax=Proteus mirabilis TaxID=584 RepID=UPI00235E1CB5|nr:glycoside hydrolase family 104 protein [Proteus mirabilis]MDC9768160.1 glycoside hydrolase family 104 protein [Proteus mirabilis]
MREAIEAGGIKIRIPAPRSGLLASACDYGPSLVEQGFKPIENAKLIISAGIYSVSGQTIGDIVVIERIPGKHDDGHIAMYNGQSWVSDFKQAYGIYPGKAYRAAKTPFVLYRYAGNQSAKKEEQRNSAQLIKIVYPIPKNARGQEFSNLDDIMAHLNGESTGSYLLGRNGMWHSGIHITNATTPWCALSSKKFEERSVFAGAYTGEQSIRCMADGEIIAYRINKTYQTIPWKSFILQLSASFVLVRHTLQLGDTERSQLQFYTLYMHLAPYSAYQKEETTPVWKLQNTLNAYPTIWREQPKTPRSTTLAKGTLVEWSPEKSETKLTITKNKQLREYGLVTVKSNKGNSQQVWILVDNNNLVRHDENDITPSWWKGFRPAPAQDVMEFDKVVSLNTPIAIKAGDSLGHMGFYQAPKEQGVESRYQVHIECISADDNLPQFLKNSDDVGINDPYYLKCLPGLMLWEKNKVGEFVKTERKTTWESLHKLSELKLETDKQQQKYYFLPEHLGYFPKQIDISDTDKDKIGSLTKRVEEIQADETKQAEYQNITQHALFLSRYDLEKIGFRALTSETTTFDYLNGYIQPKATYISAIFDIILAEANVSPRPEKGIIAHNYQRLINKIKGSATEHYNPEEYRRAFHNPMFSHLVNKAIVKHPSDWYYQSHDNVWQSFLKILSEEAPLWRSYSEAFLDNMVWMQDVTNEKLGPEVWHMHPLVFLDSFNNLNISLGELRVRAFMRMLKVGEGTVGEEGYETLFGGQSFIKDYNKNFNDHPRVSIKRGNLRSSAAGAYQVMAYTWDDANMISIRNKYSINDFTPKSQDIFCVLILKYKRKKSLNLIMEGKIDNALEILSYEWASLPPGRYGQPAKSKKEALVLYENYLNEELQGISDLFISLGTIEKIANGDY